MPSANRMAALLWLAIAASLAPVASQAHAEDRVLYRYTATATFDGAFGPVARAQQAIEARLKACGAPTSLGAYGWFGPKTRQAIIKLAACPGVAAALPADSTARTGDLTQALWAAVVGGPEPDLSARALSLTLSFEDTDYTRAEWNFCQSKPLYDPVLGEGVCYSNDRKSYVTWGPNGATAGHGREIQYVLSRVGDPALVASSFAEEAPAVLRLLLLPEGGRATEIYLCGIWAEPARREAWRAGFRRFGAAAAVRQAYGELYRSTSFDGGKIAAFHKAYEDRGLTVTEIDFAFFVDRAAHTSVAYDAVFAALQPGLTNAEARRRIAQQLRPGNPDQKRDRLGRDVAYYVDAFPAAGLTPDERSAWDDRGRRRASDVGLSDERAAPAFSPGPAIPALPATASLTPAEIAACPAAVLDTQPPPPQP